jgi:hypothetical protein
MGFSRPWGRIAIEQFSSDGDADADTTNSAKAPSRFRQHLDADLWITHVFDETSRLQSVDAPESHCMPELPKGRASGQESSGPDGRFRS